ncbi:hypothetical protein EAF04_008096 [Stromatinia cepivora]|nr:hypothetical protein EAF04_008096 [Stromatinia cepivora]
MPSIEEQELVLDQFCKLLEGQRSSASSIQSKWLKIIGDVIQGWEQEGGDEPVIAQTYNDKEKSKAAAKDSSKDNVSQHEVDSPIISPLPTPQQKSEKSKTYQLSVKPTSYRPLPKQNLFTMEAYMKAEMAKDRESKTFLNSRGRSYHGIRRARKLSKTLFPGHIERCVYQLRLWTLSVEASVKTKYEPLVDPDENQKVPPPSLIVAKDKEEVHPLRSLIAVDKKSSQVLEIPTKLEWSI